MSNDTPLQVRLDPELKDEVTDLLNELGLGHTAAVRMLYRYIQHNRRLPFTPTISTQDEDETEATQDLSIGTYSDVLEMDETKSLITDRCRKVWTDLRNRHSDQSFHPLRIIGVLIDEGDGIAIDLIEEVVDCSRTELGQQLRSIKEAARQDWPGDYVDYPGTTNEATLNEVVETMLDITRQRDSGYAGTEMLLLAVLECSPSVQHVFAPLNITRETVESCLDELLVDYESDENLVQCESDPMTAEDIQEIPDTITYIDANPGGSDRSRGGAVSRARVTKLRNLPSVSASAAPGYV